MLFDALVGVDPTVDVGVGGAMPAASVLGAFVDFDVGVLGALVDFDVGVLGPFVDFALGSFVVFN